MNTIDETIDQPLIQFLCQICGIPNYVAGTALRLELGQHSIETRAWILALNMRLEIIFSENNSLLFYMMHDNFSRAWNQAMEEKLNVLQCSENVIAALGWPLACKTIKKSSCKQHHMQS